MKYKSTQGSVTDVTFEETLFSSWLQDDSVLVPEYIPLLKKEDILLWKNYTYIDICVEIFKLFGDETFLSSAEIKELATSAYKKFPENVVKLKNICKNSDVIELFHGPTFSFKDIALHMACKVFNHSAVKTKKHSFVYTATSGDTGSAVIEVTKDTLHLDSVVLFPGGSRITDLQRLLMTTVSSSNIHCFASDSFCDNLDKFFQSWIPILREKYPDLVVTSFNSVLWIRVMVQTVHLIYGYFQVSKEFETINFVIPTGGMGHLTAAVIVQKLGFPIKIHPAFNSKNLNSFKFLQGGEYERDAESTKSNSVAIDIQYPSNMQRLLYLWSDYDTDAVRGYMSDFMMKGSCKASPELLEKIQASIQPFVTADEEVIETITRCNTEVGYLIDPHTAVGFAKHYKKDTLNERFLYMGCASPIKFMEALKKADIPQPPSYQQYLEELSSKEEFYRDLPKNEEDWGLFLIEYIEKNIMNKM